MTISRLGNYAAVWTSAIDRESLAQGFLQGYAAPQSGPRPCRVELVAGGSILAVANAAGFSDAALAADVRLGWCRFRLGGVQPAAALSETMQIRCAVSGRVIEELKTADVALASAKRPRLTLPAFRDFIAEMDGCSDLAQVHPFLQAFLDRHGDRSFVEALYRYVVGRGASGKEVDDFLLDLPANWTIADCWKEMIASMKFKVRQRTVLPGIFAPEFLFGLDLLG